MHRSPTEARRFPTIRHVLIGCGLAIVGFAGFILAIHRVQGRPTPVLQALLWATPVCVLWALAVPLVAWIDRQTARGSGRSPLWHLLGAVAVSLVVTVARLALDRLWSPGGGQELMPSGVRFFGLGLLVYAALVGLVHALRPAPLAAPAPLLEAETRTDDGAPMLPSAEAEPDRHASVEVIVRGRSVAIPWREVGWIGAAGNYAMLHIGPKTHLIRQTLQQLEDTLDPARFVRIHRSMLVNLDHLDPDAELTDEVQLRTGERLRMSRTGRARLVALRRPA